MGNDRSSPTKRVMAVASSGGHWIQIRRLASALPEDTIWVSTNAGHAGEVRPARFCTLPDADLWRKPQLLWLGVRAFCLVLFHRPTHVVSTGAAPGWFVILFARLLGAKSMWIDSIANAEDLSTSGQKARRWADLVLTQWPEVTQPAKGRLVEVQYEGAVL